MYNMLLERSTCRRVSVWLDVPEQQQVLRCIPVSVSFSVSPTAFPTENENEHETVTQVATETETHKSWSAASALWRLDHSPV